PGAGAAAARAGRPRPGAPPARRHGGGGSATVCNAAEKALMSTEIRVPQLPESVADATLVAWHKQPGDPIRRDENLADLETDKVVLEVPAPANGVVSEIRAPSGTVVTSGQVLAVIEEGAGASTAASRPAAATPQAPQVAASSAASAASPAAVAARAAAPPKPAASSAPAEAARDAGRLSPSVRRLVEENHLNPAAIPGSGRDGRLTKADVVDYLGRKPAAAVPAPAAAAVAAAAPAAPAPAPRPLAPLTRARAQQRAPMTPVRARIS